MIDIQTEWKLHPYSAYKDSAIEKLGKIPEHWKLQRLKWSLSNLESGNREVGGGNQLDYGIFSIGGEHIDWSGKLLLSHPRYISEGYYEKLRKGKVAIRDILLVKDGATIGKTAFINHLPFSKCAVNEHVFILRCNKTIDPRYLYFLITSSYAQYQIKLEITGAAQPGLGSDFISKVYIPKPPIPEQHAIATFLDRETFKIDDLIAKNQRLIELLQEKRTTLISHAVTKGLDPGVQLKDSGLEWLGEIPRHWDVKKNRFLFHEKVNRTETGEETLLMVHQKLGVVPRDLHMKDRPVIADSLVGYKLCQKNDLVLNRLKGHLGIFYRVPIDGIVSPDYTIFEKTSNIRTKYYEYLFRYSGYVTEFKKVSKGVGLGFLRLYTPEFYDIYSIVPPVNEQDDIVKYIEDQTEKIISLIKLIEEASQHLKEYRTALIAAAVTGKIDVRS